MTRVNTERTQHKKDAGIKGSPMMTRHGLPTAWLNVARGFQ